MKKLLFILSLTLISYSIFAQSGKNKKKNQESVVVQQPEQVIEQPSMGACFIYAKTYKTLTSIEFIVDSIVPAPGKPIASFKVNYLDALNDMALTPPIRMYLISIKKEDRIITPLNFPDADESYDFKKDSPEQIKKALAGLFIDSLDIKINDPVDYLSKDMFINLIKN